MSDERITVSRETLRAELSQLELRLVDRLTHALDTKADQAVLEQAVARVAAMEIYQAGRIHLPEEVVSLGRRVTTLERFRYSVPSTAIIALIVSLAGLTYGYLQ